MNDIFIHNKYSRIYFSIIEKARYSNRKKLSPDDFDFIYYESHHIIPRSFGGIETVLLTAKEHFICHLLLCKMTEGQARIKMLHALKCMQEMRGKGNKQQRYSSKIYEKLKTEICQAMSAARLGIPNLKMRGRKKSPEMINKLKSSFAISTSHKMACLENLKKATERNIGTPRTKDFKEKMKHIMTGKTKSDDSKKRMSKAAKERAKIKACCSTCRKELPVNSFGSHRRFCLT